MSFSASIQPYCHVLNPAWVSITGTTEVDYTWTLKNASGTEILSGIETGTSVQFDVSKVIESLLTELNVKQFVNQSASSGYYNLISRFTVDITDGSTTVTVSSYAVPGGIPDRLFKAITEAGSNAFKTFFFNTNAQFSLTSRTRDQEITLMETELLPICFFAYFQYMTIQDGSNIVTQITGELGNITKIYAVSLEALRYEYFVRTGKLLNRFDFYTDNFYSFSVNIAKSSEIRGYSIIFKNSYGIFEEAEISGELYNAPERDNDGAKYKSWDPVTNKLVSKRQRVIASEIIKADMGFCSQERRLWLSEMLISDECYLKVDSNIYECTVFADTLNLGSSKPSPESFLVNIEMTDKSVTFIPYVDTTKVIKHKKIFDHPYDGTYE